MAVTATLYNNAKELLLNADIDCTADTIKVALCSSSYTPDVDAHDFFDDITNEVSASGTYSAGGATLANKVVSQDNTDNEGILVADNVSFTTATITARYAILYKSTGTPGTSALIGYIDFGENVSSTLGTFTITWAAEGIINLT